MLPRVLPSGVGPRVSRWLMAACAITVGASHGLQSLLSYPLDEGRPGLGIVRDGSYGFYLAKVRPRLARGWPRPDRRQVILLGNSVEQTCGVVPRMQDRADAENAGVAFHNLAQTGSGIHDHIIQAAAVVGLKPDLLVVSVSSVAFTSDWVRRNSIPRFRTDVDQMAFDPGILSRVPASFYRREFDLHSAAPAIVSALVPIRRMDSVLRVRLARVADGHGCGSVPKLFSYPTSNLAEDWSGRRRAGRKMRGGQAPRAYPATGRLLEELAEVAGRARVPLLVLRQEAGPSYEEPDVTPQLEAMGKAWPQVKVADLRGRYRHGEYVDEIHPAEAHVDDYAARHWAAIRAALPARRP